MKRQQVQHDELIRALGGNFPQYKSGRSSAAKGGKTFDLTGASTRFHASPWGPNSQASAYKALDIVARRLCNGSTGQDEMRDGKNLRKATH